MEKKKKVLPVGDAPIQYLMRFYTPMMITFLDKEEVLPWFSSSFFLIRTQNKKRPDGLYSYRWMIQKNRNPFICKFPSPFFYPSMMKEEKLKQRVKQMIDNDWYVMLHVDLYELEPFEYYQKNHFVHSILLYGYDEEKQSVFLRGYCFGASIVTIEVDFASFSRAFFGSKKNDVWIFRRKKLRHPVKFDKKLFFKTVKANATGRCPGLYYQLVTRSPLVPFGSYYGYKAHADLQQSMQRLLEGDPYVNPEIRLYSYKEMAQCMCMRLDYIRTQFPCDELDAARAAFEALKKKYTVMLNLWLRIRVTERTEKASERMAELEQQAFQMEKQAFENLYSALKKLWGYR